MEMDIIGAVPAVDGVSCSEWKSVRANKTPFRRRKHCNAVTSSLGSTFYSTRTHGEAPNGERHGSLPIGMFLSCASTRTGTLSFELTPSSDRGTA